MKYLIIILIINLLNSCYVGRKYNNIPYPNQRYLDYDINLQQEDIRSMNGLYKYRNNYQLNEIETNKPENINQLNNQANFQNPPTQFNPQAFNEQSNLNEAAPQEPINIDPQEIYYEDDLIYNEEPIDNYYMNDNYLNQTILPYDSDTTNYRIPPQFKKEYPYDSQKAASFKKFSNIEKYLQEMRFLKKDITTHLEEFPEISSTKNKKQQKYSNNQFELIDKNYFTPQYQKKKKNKPNYQAKPPIIRNTSPNKMGNDFIQDIIPTNPNPNAIINE